ncbi:MAG: threonine synthase [Clostridiales bacterium]|jgi:threonine synthase|nr:threonine synthase [Clostridiales bacterium]
MLYHSTRGADEELTAAAAILKGIAGDGGLYAPECFPDITDDLRRLCAMPYCLLAKEILRPYLTDYTEAELSEAVDQAYGEKFDNPEVAPLTKHGGYYFLELFHGKTLAFKDMALSLLPGLLKTAARKQGLDSGIAVLTATSGDTGKAALEGFAGVEGIDIVVFFPVNGVSDMQKRQMRTQEGGNTYVIGVYGNFDDTQTGVKRIFADGIPGVYLTSANSINIGRLLPQIVYYVYAYAQMINKYGLKPGDPVNFTVPTGNFGNILAGYYARQMGLPVNRLICASNDNKVLYDFFQTHEYDKNREFIATVSPSMDILVSGNLERLLYHISGSTLTKEYMDMLSKEGRYKFCAEAEGFAAEFAVWNECFDGIRELYELSGYIIDTHTAVALKAYQKYKNRTGDTTPNVIMSTASPFKFPESVCKAIDDKYEGMDAFESVKALSLLIGGDIPASIASLEHKKNRHTTVCTPADMRDSAIKALSIRTRNNLSSLSQCRCTPIHN